MFTDADTDKQRADISAGRMTDCQKKKHRVKQRSEKRDYVHLLSGLAKDKNEGDRKEEIREKRKRMKRMSNRDMHTQTLNTYTQINTHKDTNINIFTIYTLTDTSTQNYPQSHRIIFLYMNVNFKVR